MKNKKGFTLIELMVVVSIIGILASIALPSYQIYLQRAEVVEALSMASTIKEKITDYYVEQLDFPLDNDAAGVPAPALLMGNRITSVVVGSGAIHITFGHKASTLLQGKVLSFRPAQVIGSPASPIAWLCGFDEAVPGMQAVGENKTTLTAEFLPSSCR